MIKFTLKLLSVWSHTGLYSNTHKMIRIYYWNHTSTLPYITYIPYSHNTYKTADVGAFHINQYSGSLQGRGDPSQIRHYYEAFKFKNFEQTLPFCFSIITNKIALFDRQLWCPSGCWTSNGLCPHRSNPVRSETDIANFLIFFFRFNEFCKYISNRSCGQTNFFFIEVYQL